MCLLTLFAKTKFSRNFRIYSIDELNDYNIPFEQITSSLLLHVPLVVQVGVKDDEAVYPGLQSNRMTDPSVYPFPLNIVTSPFSGAVL